MGRQSIEAGGADHGAGLGVDIGAPERAEAVGHLAEDDAGPQRAFRGVVGRRYVTIGEEDKELRAPPLGLLLQLCPDRRDGGQDQQAIEAPLGRGAVLGQSAVLQGRPSSANRNGPAQQPAEGRSKAHLAGVDGVLDVPEHVSQADLVGLGVPLLRAPAIGHPAARPVFAQHLGDDVAPA